MVENLPMISQVHFEQTAERLKIVIPVRRNWPYLLVYSVLVFLWLGMVVWGSIFLGQILFSGQSYRFLFAAMIVIMLLVLFRFGRFLGRQWATYLTDREVIFVNQEELIVRRPVSIWGNTDVYDMQHVTFGSGLTTEARQALLQFLNRTYFSAKIQ